MTNEEFIRRLKKARKLVRAARIVSDSAIWNACEAEGIPLGLDRDFCVACFDRGGDFQDWSSMWLASQSDKRKSAIAVFDNSIRALGGKP